jgi:hypothetical protein
MIVLGHEPASALVEVNAIVRIIARRAIEPRPIEFNLRRDFIVGPSLAATEEASLPALPEPPISRFDLNLLSHLLLYLYLNSFSNAKPNSLEF